MAESNYKSNGYNPAANGWYKASLGEDVSNYGYPVNYGSGDSIRAAMIAFGQFFSNVWVSRKDEDGYPRKNIHVPIKFGPRDKAFDFRKELESGKTYYIPLPNMTWKITSVQYDGTRECSTDNIRTFYDQYYTNAGVEQRQLDLLWQDTSPAPYNLGVELCANVAKMDDALQIKDQILSKFRPDAFVYVKEFWFANIRRDIKMTLDGVTFDYNEDYGEEDKRELSVKFQITLEIMIYEMINVGTVIDQIRVTLNPNLAKTRSTKDLHYEFKANPNYLDGTIPLYAVASNISAVALDIDKEPILGRENVSGWDVPYYYPRQELFENKVLTSSENVEWDFRTSGFVRTGIDYYFNSGYYDTVNESYSSFFNVSGNYKPDRSTYNSATFDYQGSLTDRYNFTELEPWQHSGNKDYYNKNNEVVRTTYVTEGYNNEGRKY